MRDKIVSYARRLESLSITELSQGAEKLVSRERRYTRGLQHPLLGRKKPEGETRSVRGSSRH